MANPTTDDYYMMAKQVSEDLPENLQAFSRYIRENVDLATELHKIMETWLRTENVYRSPYYHEKDTAINVLWYINATNSSQTSVSNNRKSFFERRRHRRYYLAKVFEKEYASGESAIFQACDEYFKMFGGSKDCKYPTKQAYIDDYASQIRAWASETNADLINYPLQTYLKPPKKVQDYILDMSCCLFEMIITRYHSNPIRGMVTSFPKNILDSAVFAGGSSKQKADVTINYSKDRISAVEHREVHQADGSVTSTKYVAGSVDGSFPDNVATDSDVQTAIISNLQAEGKMFDIQSSLLDARDRTLFTYLYNSFTMDDISSGRKVMPLNDVVRALDMAVQQKSYIYVMRRIDKMLRYRMDYTTYAENGKDVRETGSMVLFSRVGYQMPDKDGGVGNTTFNMSDSSTPASYLDVLEHTDLKNVIVAIEPSPFLKEVMIRNVTVNILTKEYLAVIPDKMKSFLMVLQEERMRVYPDNRVSLDYSFFSERLRFERLKPYAVKKQVKEALEYLMDAGIVVKSFDMRPYNVVINFSPFTDTEKLLCRVDAGNRSLQDKKAQ